MAKQQHPPAQTPPATPPPAQSPQQQQFPAATTARWPAPNERAHIGKPIKRIDGPDKATGRAKYTYDIIRPGMLYARLLDSPHASARVRDG